MPTPRLRVVTCATLLKVVKDAESLDPGIVPLESRRDPSAGCEGSTGVIDNAAVIPCP